MNDALPKQLTDACREGTLIPFVGAGVSKSVKLRDGGKDAFPTWHGLLTRAADRLQEEQRRQQSVVRAMLEQSPPNMLEAARYAQEGLAALWPNFLKDVFNVTRANIEDASLSLAAAIWELGSNLVITTNYDYVLRWACPRRDDLAEWPIEAPAGLVDALQRKLPHPTVWHLHGSVIDSARIILAPDGYSLLYAEGTENRYKGALSALRQMMVSRHFLFIGFSLSDALFMRQLEWVRDTFSGYAGPHYVLARADEIEGMKSRVHGLNIEFVPFSAFGPPMEARIRQIGKFCSPAVGMKKPATTGRTTTSRATVRGPSRPVGRNRATKPKQTMEEQVRELGRCTVAQVKEDPAIEDVIARLTGLEERRVREKIRGAVGKTHLRTVFAGDWPGDDSEIEVQALGRRTATSTKADLKAILQIAVVTRLEGFHVKKELERAIGKTHVRTVFEQAWPADDDDEDQEDEDEGEEAIDVEDLGQETVASAKLDPGMIVDIGRVTGLDESTVVLLLWRSAGNAHVQTVFRIHWANADIDVEALGRRTVASVKEDPDAIRDIIAVTGLSKIRVSDELGWAAGNRHVQTLFDWPDDEDEFEVGDIDIDSLGRRTVASALSDGEAIVEIAHVTGLDASDVVEELLDASGNTHVQTLFSDEWPD